MRNFSYVKAESPESTVSALEASDGTGKIRILAGGTDIIPLVKDDIISPDTLIDITGWAGGTYIREEGDAVVIGALTPLSSIADNSLISERYTALTQACSLAATPQLRNMGTIGGNVLQQTRCWYYRGPFDCWLKGGDTCYARNGENENHSIFHTTDSPCVSAHPSDPAAALLAFDARVRFRTQSGEEEVALEELYALPEASRRSFVKLPVDAVITSIVLPAATPGTRSTYVKAMARASWGFALAGVAIVLEGNAEIRSARVALSGVAPIPIRPKTVEEALIGTESVDVKALADLLVLEAEPLSHNKYKIALLRGVFAEAMGVIWQTSS